MLAVAHKCGFGAFLEFPLEKQTSGRSAHKKIDAVLIYGKQALAFELKTIRKNAIGFNLQEDLRKLRRFPDEVAQDCNQRRATSWQLVSQVRRHGCFADGQNEGTRVREPAFEEVVCGCPDSCFDRRRGPRKK